MRQADSMCCCGGNCIERMYFSHRAYVFLFAAGGEGGWSRPYLARRSRARLCNHISSCVVVNHRDSALKRTIINVVLVWGPALSQD